MFEIFGTVNGQFQWRLLSRNGKIICGPEETFKQRRTARASINKVKLLAPFALIKDLSLKAKKK